MRQYCRIWWTEHLPPPNERSRHSDLRAYNRDSLASVRALLHNKGAQSIDEVTCRGAPRLKHSAKIITV